MTAFISNHSVGPNMEIELFFLTPEPGPPGGAPAAHTGDAQGEPRAPVA